MNVRASLPLAFGFAILAAPALSQAHFLWVTLDPAAKTAAVGFQEYPGIDPLPLGERAPRVKAWTKGEKALALKAEGQQLTGAAQGEVVGASLDYGVIDRREQGRGLFWLNYHAKAAANAQASQTKLGLPVELTVAPGTDGKLVLTVLRSGKPAAGAEVVVEQPSGTPAFEGKTGADGTASIPAAQVLAIRAMIQDDVKGAHEGKAYDFVRSYGTLTVGKPAPAKPLTKQLHEAFGDNHDVVGRTAMISTLMAGKLTKAQLAAHYQQRALIHEAVDAVLRATDKPVPYGADQKAVIDLLRDDMRTAGIAWPTEAMATPLTQAMLREIRESAKTGPYFALGVLHVYYGGITHGGRDIGRTIGETFKTEPPTYYLKSDGYADYARRVNEITDPAAQRETIRGGVAAYRYIIASNDDPIFKKG